MSTVMIGVSIAIPEPHSSVLAGWRKRIGDSEAENVPPHVTLLPPTALSLAEMDEVTEHLERACSVVGPFRMKLSGTGTFRPVSPVVFVAVSVGIAGNRSLATDAPVRIRDLNLGMPVTRATAGA